MMVAHEHTPHSHRLVGQHGDDVVCFVWWQLHDLQAHSYQQQTLRRQRVVKGQQVSVWGRLLWQGRGQGSSSSPPPPATYMHSKGPGP